jgi:hypothetical protein
MTDVIPIKKEWPFICLGVPCGMLCHSEFMQSIWAIGRQYPGKQGLIKGHSSIIVNARNQIVEAAQMLKPDYILFLDSDMTFPQDTPKRLLAHGKDIVCATYVRRGPPFDLLGNSSTPDIRTGLVEMTHIPTGCLLVKTSVFDCLKRPYFRLEANEERETTLGEDYIFTRMMLEHGHRVWCDLDLTEEIGHMVQYELKPADARRMAEANAPEKAAVNG